MDLTVGKYSLATRIVCTALVLWPLVYRVVVREGSAVEFLALLVLAVVAGLVLLGNSIYCLIRYRSRKTVTISLIFIALSMIGFATACYYLPQFRM